jgi:signal transduction histidine kinase
MRQAGPLEHRWEEWRLARNRRGFRTGLVIMITLYPAFGVLDWLLAPPSTLHLLWATRVLVAGVTIALFRGIHSAFFARHADVLTATYVWLAAAGISSMTAYVGGLASPYYAGLTLTLLATGLLMLWPARVVIVTNAAIVASFLAFNVFSRNVGEPFAAVSNLAFLSATALIAGVGQVLQFRTQREQYEQRVRLEQATERLERAHAELKQLDQFKSRFFANITHELRTPLAIVLTPLELMLQGEMGEFSESQRTAFQTMFKSALKLLKLINDLLDLSRLEESRLRLEVREHDLVAQLRGLTEETVVLARRKSLSLEFATDAERALVHCDPERLERVFVNLLSNAVKFTPPGGHVHVGLREEEAAFHVVVEDDGPGFPPGEAQRLFERFYQVDMAGTRQHGGAGIGLALARELVLLHGGAIEAHSDGSHGARFTVTLRKGSRHFRPEVLLESERHAAAGEGDFGADSGVQLSARRDFRLLDIEEATERRVVQRDPDEKTRPYTAVVVEDNQQIVRLVHMALRRHFKVLAAPDGLQGLEMVVRERPSLVVTDLMMPGIDGLELTRRLREDPQTRHIPVLMLTARGELDDRVKGLETGVSAYLTKPFSPRELVTCARELVRAKERTADLVLTDRMESLEIVTAGLAHEINNPLNYVKNALARVRLDVEQAMRLAGEARIRPLAGEDRQRLERAAARSADLLGVADAGLKRIAGTVELMGRYGRAGFRRELAHLDLWEAVRTVVGVVLPATGRAVEVELALAGDGTVECVPEELHQVIANLVQNAIEAAPEGSGRVRVAGAAHGEEIVLSVKDNGPGIAPEVRARLFTPFFTTKGPGRGQGLGLTITRRVVESLGGTIQVVSAPGAGAELEVRLPRRQAGAGHHPAAGRAEERRDAGSGALTRA